LATEELLKPDHGRLLGLGDKRHTPAPERKEHLRTPLLASDAHHWTKMRFPRFSDIIGEYTL